MILRDVPFGRVHTLEVESTAGREFPDVAQPGSEVKLSYYVSTNQNVLEFAEETFDVRGANTADGYVLADLASRNLPRLAWVVLRIPDDRATRLVIQVHSFPQRYSWDSTLDLCIDEYTLQEIRKVQRDAAPTLNRGIAWLNDQFILPGTDLETSRRLFISAGPTANAGEPQTAFRIHGPNFAADVRKGDDDLLRVWRLKRFSKKDKEQEEQHPVLLAEVAVRFCLEQDATEEGRFRDLARTQLDTISRKSNSYIQIWSEYRKLEYEQGLAESRKIRALRYESWTHTSEGKFRFQLADQEGLERRLEAVKELKDGSELEAGEEEPDWVHEAPPESATENAGDPPLPVRRRRRGGGRGRLDPFSGSCGPSDVRAGNRTITLKRVRGKRPMAAPPESGYLYPSRRGDDTKQARREAAERKIRAADSPMPQLGLILEDVPVPSTRQRWIDPMSPQVRRLFKRPPTPRQLEAIEVALNTPDMALIQGPPGTGKTTVIAALLCRLPEVVNTTGGVSGLVLLSSFQHDAVENAAERAKVFGPPPRTFGGRKQQSPQAVHDSIYNWARGQIDQVRRVRERFPELPVTEVQRKVQALTVRYVRATGHAEETASLLGEVADATTDFVQGPLRDRLLEMILRLRRGVALQTPSDEVQAAARCPPRSSLRCEGVRGRWSARGAAGVRAAAVDR